MFLLTETLKVAQSLWVEPAGLETFVKCIFLDLDLDQQTYSVQVLNFDLFADTGTNLNNLYKLYGYSVSADGLDPIFSLSLLYDGVPINLTFFSLRWVLDWCVCISKLFTGHFKYLKYNGFLSFVLRKLNETNTFFLCLVVTDGDYTLEGAVSPIINLSLQSKLLPTE